jgi:hypothetical protein
MGVQVPLVAKAHVGNESCLNDEQLSSNYIPSKFLEPFKCTATHLLQRFALKSEPINILKVLLSKTFKIFIGSFDRKLL